MGVWNTATPAGSDPKSQGDDRIREIKVAVQEALQGGATEGDEAIFPGSAPSTAPVFHYRGLKGSTGSRPASGQYGQYFDTTRNVLQRDNGSTWDDIGTVIPAGTVMPFYQASAPVGWTKIVTQNDKVFRVVSGSGGAAGGSIATSTGLAHSHSIDAHTHTFAANTGAPNTFTNSIAGGGGGSAAGTDHVHNLTVTSSATALTTDSQLGVLAYIDLILASKD